MADRARLIVMPVSGIPVAPVPILRAVNRELREWNRRVALFNRGRLV